MRQPDDPTTTPSSAAHQHAQHAKLFRGGTRLLFAFWTLYVLTLWFLLISGLVGAAFATTMALILIAECVGLCLWDWSNVSTLYGTVPLSTMPLWRRILLGVLAVAVFPAVPAIYLLLATTYHFRAVGMSPRQLLGAWYTRFISASRWAQAGALVATIALVIFFCSGTTVALASIPTPPASPTTITQSNNSHALAVHATATTRNDSSPQSTATATATPEPTATPLPTATVAPTATAVPATPTSRPIVYPTATPRPVYPTATPKPIYPTATPKPTCNYGGAPSNPWCFTFNNTGKLIYGAPSGFCSYFSCIGSAPYYTSFWNGKGYVIECNDGKFSQSGGIQGACSYHGGELRPLYKP